MRLPVNEALRIVDDDLWERVRSRRADTSGKALRFADGRMSWQPPKTATQNLLAGLTTCGACGGSLVVETSKRTHGRIPEYVCFRHRNHRTGICANQRHVAVAEMNEAVLQAIEQHALTPEAVEQVIALTERDDACDQHDNGQGRYGAVYNDPPELCVANRCCMSQVIPTYGRSSLAPRNK